MADPALRAAAVDNAPVPLVLMYHSVTEYTVDPYLVTVRPERFDQQCRWLRRRGLTGTSMRELLDARRAGTARGLVGLTFDDGYTDFADTVLPILLQYGFRATVFVVAGRLGGHNAWDEPGPYKPLMTPEQVRHVAESGIEIGSHGMLHVSLPTAPADELTREVAQSRTVLQQLTGQKIRGFCYPYGDVSAGVIGKVRESGYDYACAIWRSALTGRLALPRTYVGDTDRALRLTGKRLRHRLRHSRPILRNA